MYCGLPFVSTEVGIANELLTDSVGVMISSPSPMEIFSAMKKLWLNRDAYKADVIRAHVESITSPEYFCQKIRNLLSSKTYAH